ncbi:MAG: ornithine cyclodeaminase family protein, partial [Lentisphaerae bacterium]|nr:ornithine cyclodeaminase family protein [Lentisphaerota bacterium]
RSGDLRAVVSGDWISDMRTGAQPTIACKYLAASTHVVTIIGTGRQAYASLLCMSTRLDIREVRLCDIRPAARQRFMSLFPNAPFNMVECQSNEEACRGSDVIITVTNADARLVEEPWVKKGALVLTMGSFTETSDDVVLKADRLIADHIGQSLHRGNIASMAHRGLVDEASFAAELPRIVAGTQVGREHADERITCQLVGMGAPDAAVAALLIEKMQNAGVEIPTFELT